MNNWDYMAEFYSWLYSYGKLTKNIRSLGYTFADSCDFNNVYIWLKGYFNQPINRYVKKQMEKEILNKKCLTAEPIFQDALTTYFSPYVGSIEDDIDWIVYCMNIYKFLSDGSNEYETKYQKLRSLFDIKNGQLDLSPTARLIQYILSGTNAELKITLDVFRDTTTNVNQGTLIKNIQSVINEFFKIENRKLGEKINISDLISQIYEIPGIAKLVTNKQRNIGIFKDGNLPIINSVVAINGTTETNISAFEEYPFSEDTSIRLSLNIEDNSEIYGIQWYKMNMTTGQEEPIPYATSNTYNVSFLGVSYDTPTNSFYAKITKLEDGSTYFTNRIKITFSGTGTPIPGSPELVPPENYSFENMLYGMNNSILTGKTQWETIDKVQTLSLATWTPSLVDGKDFTVIGNGQIKLQSFCFPALLEGSFSNQDNIKFKEDELEDIGIEY
jgi:hypothetical protein